MKLLISLISLISNIIIAISSFEYSFPEQTASQSSKVERVLEIIAQTQGQSLPVEAKTMINEQVIELEVAKTPEQQSIGLMYRED
ncbi:MAG: hypothetical protein ACP8RL_01105 [cyanobacterium endosymbiont of Rhopalodia inflata]